MNFTFNDGGRKAAGFRGATDDCVARAITIATQGSYSEVYHALNAFATYEKHSRGRLGLMAATGRGSSARTGVHKKTWRRYIESLGWVWTPTMKIGSGCKVHLRGDELPAGRLIVACSKHLVAVIDGVVHDTHDSTREGTRCVYGYFTKAAR